MPTETAEGTFKDGQDNKSRHWAIGPRKEEKADGKGGKGPNTKQPEWVGD